jgi:hypothetical protein
MFQDGLRVKQPYEVTLNEFSRIGRKLIESGRNADFEFFRDCHRLYAEPGTIIGHSGSFRVKRLTKRRKKRLTRLIQECLFPSFDVTAIINRLGVDK